MGGGACGWRGRRGTGRLKRSRLQPVLPAAIVDGGSYRTLGGLRTRWGKKPSTKFTSTGELEEAGGILRWG